MSRAFPPRRLESQGSLSSVQDLKVDTTPKRNVRTNISLIAPSQISNSTDSTPQTTSTSTSTPISSGANQALQNTQHKHNQHQNSQQQQQQQQLQYSNGFKVNVQSEAQQNHASISAADPHLSPPHASLPTMVDGKPIYRLSDPASVRLMLDRQGHPISYPSQGNSITHQQQHHHHQQQQNSYGNENHGTMSGPDANTHGPTAQQISASAISGVPAAMLVGSFLDQHPDLFDIDARPRLDRPVPSERLFVPPLEKKAANEAETKYELYEIGVTCQFDLQEPMHAIAVMFTRQKGGKMWEWKEIGRTESVFSLHHRFSKALLLEHEVGCNQPIKLCVYATDDEIRYVRNLDPYGEAFFSEAEFVRSEEQTIVRDLRSSSDGIGAMGTGVVGSATLEIASMRTHATMAIQAKDIREVNSRGLSDPFYAVFRFQADFYSNPKNAGRPEEEAFESVYRSEIIKSTVTPVWRPFKISLKRLCDNDLGNMLLFRCYDWDATGVFQVIGEFKTNLYEICVAKGLVSKGSEDPDVECSGETKIAEFQLIQPQMLLKKEQAGSGIFQYTNVEVIGQEIIISEEVQKTGDDKFNEARSAIYARSKYSGRSRARSRASAPSFKKQGRRNQMDDTGSFGRAFGAVSWSGGLSGITDEEEDDEDQEDTMSDIDEETNECITMMIENMEKPSEDDHFKTIMEIHGLVYYHEKLRRAFIDRGGLDVLLDMLDSSPLIQEKVVFVLKNMSVSAHVRERLRATGAIIRIAHYLESAESYVQRQIAWLITHVCSDCGHTRDMLREQGVLETLRQLIESSDPGLLDQVLLTTAAVCHQNEMNQNVAIGLGFLFPVVVHLSSTQEKVQLAALNLVSNLTSHSHVGRETVREIGGFAKILHFLDTDDDVFKYSTLCAISTIIYDNATNQDILRETGCLKKIAAAISHPLEHMQEIAAICVINAVTNNEKNKTCVREYNAIMPLLSLAKGKLPSLPYLATAAARNLGTISHNRTFIQRLVRLLH